MHATARQPQPESKSQQPRRSIFAADLAPEPDEEPEPLAEIVQQPPEPEAIDPQAADSARLKQRMIHASQARRKEGPDLVSETIDPVLPDWYDPSSVEEESDEATVTASPGKR